MADAKDKVRVLIVEDSGFMRKVLHDIIASDPQLEVVGEARDGREGVALAQTLKPDVITMDINMPHLDGLQATEFIMSQNPKPIVIVSSESRDGADSTLRALELGAVDFVPKPSSGIDLDMHRVSGELNRKLKTAAKVRVVRTATLPRAVQQTGKSPAAGSPVQSVPLVVPAPTPRFPCVVVGASTGGPATVMTMIPRLPKDLPAAVVLVQHMPAAFTGQFTVQLGEASALRVKEAQTSEVIQAGTVYICPGSHHLRFATGGRIALDGGERISGYRPCVDVALETAADYMGAMTIGVILTGMGNDGARGAKAVKSAGGYMIAQDESTSVIFGMPAEVIKTGAVDEILKIDGIAAAIERRVTQLCRVSPVNTR